MSSRNQMCILRWKWITVLIMALSVQNYHEEQEQDSSALQERICMLRLQRWSGKLPTPVSSAQKYNVNTKFPTS